MDTKQQVDYYRRGIREMLKRVPASVNAGSYDTAVAFKKLVAKATKAAEASNPKLAVLIETHNQLQQYY